MAWTGTVPSFTAGERARASKLQTLADIATALTDPLATWVPTYANITVGSGAVVAKYLRVGAFVHYYWRLQLNSSTIGTAPSFTLPVAPASWYPSSETFPGQVSLLDSGTTNRIGRVQWTGSALLIESLNATPAFAQITSTAPWTWANGDAMLVTGTYAAA